MIARKPISRRRKFRFKTLAFVLLGVVVLGAGGTWIYFIQSERNTQKLKSLAAEMAAKSDWAKAATNYRLYLNRRENDLEALAAYADVLVTMTKESPEQLGNAVRVLQRLVRLQPTNVKAIRDLTSAYLLVSEFTLAEDMAGNWVGLAPDSAEAVVSLATARRGLKKYDLALEALMRGVERMPNEASLYPPIIALYTVELAKPDEGKIWLEKALIAGPNSHSIQLAAFAYQNTRGDFAKAEEHLKIAIDAAPDDPSVLLPAASYFTERNDLPRAKELLDRIASKSPDNHRMHIALAAWAAKNRDPVVVTSTAKQLEDWAGEKNSEILARAAELYLAARQPNDADRCIVKLEAIPNPSPAVQTWISALRGSRDVSEGRPHGAVAHLEEVLRKEPNDARTLELLGRAYLDMGALEPAADSFRRLLGLSPDVPAFRITLARIELQLGRDAAATGLLVAIPNATPEQQSQIELLRLACDMRRAIATSPSAEQLRDLRERLQRVAGEPPVDESSARLLSTCFALAAYPSEMSEELSARMADETTGTVVASEYASFLLYGRQFEAAKRIIDELESKPKAAEAAQRLRVKWLVATDGATAARKYIDSMSQDGPAKGELFVALADQCADLGRREDALEAYTAAVGYLPERVPLLQQIRRLALTREQSLEAVSKMHAIEGEAGLTWRLERALAILQFNPDANMVQEAVGLIQHCVDRRKDWPTAFIALGNARELLGEWEPAAQAYQTAINQQPSLATGSVALRLVGVLNRLQRFVESDVLLGRVLEANPRSADALALLVEKQVRSKDLSAAADAAEQLLAAKPGDPSIAALVADLMLQKGNVPRADEVVSKGLEGSPDAIALQWSRVRVRMAQGENDQAKTLAVGIAQQTNAAKDYWFLGQVFEQLGDKKAAEDAVRKAVEIAPQDAQLLAGVAEFWRTRGDRAKQVDMARKAVAARGDDPQSQLALAELLVGSESSIADQKEAAEIVARRLATAPDDPRALALDALLAGSREKPDLDHSLKQLQKALALNPKLPKAHQLLAAVQIRRGDMKAAGDAVAAGLAIDPDNIELLLLSAEVYGYRGEYEQSMLPLRRILEIRPRSTQALRLLPESAGRANQLDRGIKIVESGAAGGPMNAEELVALARLYDMKKELPKAEALYLQAVAAAPADSSIFQSLLHFQSRQGAVEKVRELAEKRKIGQPDDVASVLAAAHLMCLQSVDAKLRDTGISWLMSAASSHPTFAADAVYRAGVCHLQAGEVPQAESAFLQAAQYAPTAAEPVNALAWLYSEELNRPEDALSVLQKFLTAGGRETPQMLDTHAAVLLRLEQFDAARTKLLACIDAAGQTETLTAATFHLGKLLHKQQKQNEAIVHLRRAIDLDKRFGGLSDRERTEITSLLSETTIETKQ